MPKKKPVKRAPGAGRKPLPPGEKKLTLSLSVTKATVDRIERYAVVNGVESKSAAVVAMLAVYPPL